MGIQKDGYQTLVTLSGASSGIVFGTLMNEKGVTPPPIQGTGAIDITSMRNSNVRTFYPKQLYTLGNATFTGSYDPDVYSEIQSLIGVNQEITITFPDNKTLQFWGSLDVFAPNESVEGEQPTAQITIIATNLNDSDVETEPTWPS